MGGLAWQGRAHRSLDDAKITARLLGLLMHKGFKFAITNSLMWQASDGLLTWNPILENMAFSPRNPCRLTAPPRLLHAAPPYRPRELQSPTASALFQDEVGAARKPAKVALYVTICIIKGFDFSC